MLADDPNRLPTRCETCKYLAEEISTSLKEHTSFDVINTNYRLDDMNNKQKPTKYMDSEVRYVEVIESGCEGILKYNVHAERSGSLRYSRGESQTMGTLKGLRDRGVKVELGIPEDKWDEPSAEITNLKRYCDAMVEEHEESIEEWYKTGMRSGVTLNSFLCQRVLKEDEKSCLTEVFVEKTKEEK